MTCASSRGWYAGPVIAAAIALVGCSTLSWFWRYADSVIANRVEEWVELTPVQRQQLGKRLDPWLDRLAVERMPTYTRFMRRLARRADRGIKRVDAVRSLQHALGLYRKLKADAISAWIAPTLAELNADQRRRLARRIQADNADYRAHYIDVSRSEGNRALADRLVEAVERWTGSLNQSQAQSLRAGVRELPDASHVWYRYRLRMQAGLLALLAQRPERESPASLTRYLDDWWVRQAHMEPRQRRRLTAFRKQLVALLADIAITLDRAQRAELANRLRSLSNQLEAIEDQVRQRMSQ